MHQIHHGVATNLGNGQMRLQTNYNPAGGSLRRDGVSSLIAYDPHFQHMAADDRRESTASVASSLGSFESGSTLTSDLGDNAIMTRLRKSFEQKEEFLRRGITQAPEITVHQQQIAATQSNGNGQWQDSDSSGDKCKLILNQLNLRIFSNTSFFLTSYAVGVRHQREFYARPNRLQKTVWPPPEFESKRSSMAKDIVNNENSTTATNKLNLSDSCSTSECSIQNQKLSTSLELQSQQQQQEIMPLQPKSTNTLPPHRLANHLAREQFYNGTKEIIVVPQQHSQQSASSDYQNSMEMEENW